MNNKKIIFFGGTGQCKVMRPIADIEGTLKSVLDETVDLSPPFADVKLYNGPTCYEDWKNDTLDYKNYYFCVTIGNPNAQARIDISDKLIKDGLRPLTLIHKTALIEKYTKLGEGLQIHADVVINPCASVGDYCILNTKSLVEHDCVLGPGVELGPGSVLCGNIRIGKNTWIGAGSVIRQNIKIGENVIVGAGSVVVKDIPDNEIVVGNPARPFTQRQRNNFFNKHHIKGKQ